MVNQPNKQYSTISVAQLSGDLLTLCAHESNRMSAVFLWFHYFMVCFVQMSPLPASVHYIHLVIICVRVLRGLSIVVFDVNVCTSQVFELSVSHISTYFNSTSFFLTIQHKDSVFCSTNLWPPQRTASRQACTKVTGCFSV